MRSMTPLQYDSNDGCWSCRRRHHRRSEHNPHLQHQPDLSMTHQCQVKNDNKNPRRSFIAMKTNTTRLFMVNTIMVSLLLLQYIHVTPTPTATTYCTAFTATVDTRVGVTSRTETRRTTITPQRSLWSIDHRSRFASEPSVYHHPQPHHQQRWMSRPTTATTTNQNNSAAKSRMVTRGKTGSRMITSIEEYTQTILKTTTSLMDNNTNNDNDDHPILLFWTAPWCGPCRLSIPIIKGIRKVYDDDVSTYEICTDDVMELPDMVGITSIPTIQLYYQGKLYDTIIGCVSQQVLSSSIDKVLEDVQKIKLQKQLRSMKQPITTVTNPLVVITTTTSTSTGTTGTASEEYANNHNNNTNHHDFVS